MAGIVDDIHILQGDTQTRVASLVLPTLTVHAHVPEKIRAKIWLGEFVDLYTLLPEVSLGQQDFSLTIRSGDNDSNPAVCMIPRAKSEIRSFPQWSKAFQIFMSVFLMKPDNALAAPKMLKYMHVVRNLSERGGNWRGYDESFRTLMRSEGWAWDCINYELWLNAAQQPLPRVAPQVGSSFLNRGTGTRSNAVCFAFNQARCMRNPCRFRHLCRWCGGSHPGFQSPKSHIRKSTNFQRPGPKP